METNLVYYLGKSPEIKVLDFLIENKRTSWNITEIENQGGIARATLKLVIPRLLKLELLKVDRQIGNSKLYTINGENLIIKKLIGLSNLLDDVELEKHRK